MTLVCSEFLTRVLTLQLHNKNILILVDLLRCTFRQTYQKKKMRTAWHVQKVRLPLKRWKLAVTATHKRAFEKPRGRKWHDDESSVLCSISRWKHHHQQDGARHGPSAHSSEQLFGPAERDRCVPPEPLGAAGGWVVWNMSAMYLDHRRTLTQTHKHSWQRTLVGVTAPCRPFTGTCGHDAGWYGAGSSARWLDLLLQCSSHICDFHIFRILFSSWNGSSVTCWNLPWNLECVEVMALSLQKKKKVLRHLSAITNILSDLNFWPFLEILVVFISKQLWSSRAQGEKCPNIKLPLLCHSVGTIIHKIIQLHRTHTHTHMRTLTIVNTH